MRDVVFTRQGWFPAVVRCENGLSIELAAGADANHDPRVFRFPVDEVRAAVIEADLRRHLLLWSAVLPLCGDAGSQGDLDVEAAVALLDPTLLGTPDEVDALFRGIRWDWRLLMAHGGDIDLLDDGKVWAALSEATVTPDRRRVEEYEVNRRRAQRGVTLAPLDTAILRFTGQYVHGATLPNRLPDEVDPELLPDVLRVIATAERATTGMRIGLDPRHGRGVTDKAAWERVATVAEEAVRAAHPELADDAVATVRFLMCSEVRDRSKNLPEEDDAEGVGDRAGGPGGVRTARLTFTDDKEVAQPWAPGDSRTAGAAFWEFVASRSAPDNEVFTIEDEQLGEGLQLHFSADSVARITTVTRGEGASEPEYRVEYTLVDGLDGFRTRVRAFVDGGCAALDPHGPWTADLAELERARTRRREANS